MRGAGRAQGPVQTGRPPHRRRKRSDLLTCCRATCTVSALWPRESVAPMVRPLCQTSDSTSRRVCMTPSHQAWTPAPLEAHTLNRRDVFPLVGAAALAALVAPAVAKAD